MTQVIRMVFWLLKQTLKIWIEGVKIMFSLEIFKPTDMLVKSQVTMFLLNLHKDILDVPPLYNLRQATAEAMGMDYDDALKQAEERRKRLEEEEEESEVAE